MVSIRETLKGSRVGQTICLAFVKNSSLEFGDTSDKRDNEAAPSAQSS